MEKIQLLYVENIISRQQGQIQQKLVFFMQVENIVYDKNIDVIWSGEDGIWHTLSGWHHSDSGSGREYWQAQITLILTEEQSLAGNIMFGLRYRIADKEYWDNNDGHNYSSEADSGIKLTNKQQIQNIDFSNCLNNEQQALPVSVAIDKSIDTEAVTIYWTTDNWATTKTTPCQSKKMYWENIYSSNARNPNQYDIELWTGLVEHKDASQLQYVICCESNGQELWDNNFNNNYSMHQKQLKVLILNLHCYQEENQDEKLSIIAQAINEQDIDIICLQEVAEYWKGGEGDWESNTAKLINDRLNKSFHMYTDWSHLGFDKYREGVAILSRYPLLNPESRYVSDSDDIYDIHSRKVVMAQVQVPHIGPINVFSVHLSWLEDGFRQQFHKLHKWAESRYTEDVKATLLCGDFNITAGTNGYELVVDSNQYDDQFIAANDHGVFEKIFRVADPHWQDLLSDDYRIDYIFMNKTSKLQVTSAQLIFSEQDYGRVSDHCGYLMSFETED